MHNISENRSQNHRGTVIINEKRKKTVTVLTLFHLFPTLVESIKYFYFRHLAFHRRAFISHNANFFAVAEHAMRENHEITWDGARKSY